MKRFVVLSVSIVLISILFCPLVMAAPSMPADVQMVQPDSSLPKELSAFWGKWEDAMGSNYFLIVEKIDQEKASLYFWWSGDRWVVGSTVGWQRIEAKPMKAGGKYKLWYRGPGPMGTVTLTLKGEYLDVSGWNARLKRVQ